MTQKRIAVIHFHLESNRLAPVTNRDEFVAQKLAIGEAFERRVSAEPPVVSKGTKGFMHAFGAFEPVAIFDASAGAGGMIDGAFFDELLQVVRDRLPPDIDGVYLDAHGACIATNDEDPDGTLITLIRDIIGPKTPLVVTLDLHCHVSQAMIDGADFLSAYQTNPHVDQFERGEEAGHAMQRLFAGETTARALVRLPFTPPSTTLNTDAGPYGRMMDAAVARAEGAIWNVSLCSGFSVGDSSKAGVNVTVTADTSEAALSTARDIGQAFWDARDEFNIQLTPVDDAVALMLSEPEPRIYGDVADNPGGGGRGNTLATLKAMHAAGVQNAIIGMLYDPELAAEATSLGEGAVFEARFNRSETDPQSGTFTATCTVLQLASGTINCRRGLYAGGQQDLGPCALLDCGGIKIIISSIRRQLCDPAFIERFGLDIADFQTVVVKSRGHFRAGFDEFFPPNRVVEIDGPGLTTPVLSRIPFTHTPRPMHPLDENVEWSAATAGSVSANRASSHVL